MPKKAEKKSALDMVTWVEGLPDQGGAWGKGITETIVAMESEADSIDKDVESLEGQIKTLKDKAAQRRSMAMQTARRALREAPKLFDPELVKKLTQKPAAPEEPAKPAPRTKPSSSPQAAAE